FPQQSRTVASLRGAARQPSLRLSMCGGRHRMRSKVGGSGSPIAQTEDQQAAGTQIEEGSRGGDECPRRGAAWRTQGWAEGWPRGEGGTGGRVFPGDRPARWTPGPRLDRGRPQGDRAAAQVTQIVPEKGLNRGAGHG